ncbi:MAG: ATPase [Alphaproteobacteria bacterium RIFCSPLOWO2_01_FULL_40_26]|nr:MAG: ATPase [Alphaproteobacteria bacterium RIFCSPHIGHO2_02_FULL_40_34]OFW94164.1 MAG: ATPase [Alphaproteobacteria bacterium RIFCSPLOWO2_01_FULL_40_26]OFX09733.1 MAG: ATPase [Alphaproteobacteria bacterium RIFCSPLOWO2_02_FULL_40_19]
MLKRTIVPTLEKLSRSFPVLMLSGPRQVGKTTILEACLSSKRNYVTLDDHEVRAMAQKDPALFLQTYKPPLVIDEVQYAPQLFSYIKIIVDRTKKNGMFWLTGSQKFHLMKGITESLAGRVAIVDILGFSQSEIADRANKSKPFLPTKKWLDAARKNVKKTKNLKEIYHDIWIGSYPRAVLGRKDTREVFYKSYVQTYIQRDVRDLLKIEDETAFRRFLRICAARTGQLLNYSDMARDCDIDHKTIKSWLSILETSGLVYLLHPYYRNVTKRMVKAPKLYFLDTGLCAFLTQWPTHESLEAGAMSGAILETYIFAEILKSYWHNGRDAYFYYYRDLDQKEIDLLIEEGDVIYPIEFKKTATPSITATKSFSTLKKLGKKIGNGAVICLRETDIALSREVMAIPVSYL